MRLVTGERIKQSAHVAGYSYPVDILECDHELRKPVIDSTADALAATFRKLDGKPYKRRCHECGKTAVIAEAKERVAAGDRDGAKRILLDRMHSLSMPATEALLDQLATGMKES